MPASDKPLTALKAFRVQRNLSPDKICQAAGISRSYFTRLEQGGVPAPDVAAMLVRVLNSNECARDRERAQTEHGAKLLGACEKILNTRLGGLWAPITEIHLLYPDRFAGEEVYS